MNQLSRTIETLRARCPSTEYWAHAPVPHLQSTAQHIKAQSHNLVLTVVFQMCTQTQADLTTSPVFFYKCFLDVLQFSLCFLQCSYRVLLVIPKSTPIVIQSLLQWPRLCSSQVHHSYHQFQASLHPSNPRDSISPLKSILPFYYSFFLTVVNKLTCLAYLSVSPCLIPRHQLPSNT